MSLSRGSLLCSVSAGALFLGFALLAAPSLSAQGMAIGSGEIAFQMAMPRSFLGVGVAEIDGARSRALNLKSERGVEITRVESASPAEKAGLQTGDVVLSYGAHPVAGIEQFARMVRETPLGRRVVLDISRNGKMMSIPVTIGALKGNFIVPVPDMEMDLVSPEFFGFADTPDVPNPVMAWNNSSIGVEGETLEGQLADFFGVKEGVLIRGVAANSPAARGGIRAGDVITRIDGQPVSSPREITSVLRSRKPDSTLPVQLVRGRKGITVEIPMDDSTARKPRPTPARSVKN
jgi:serine protease Do